MARLLLAVLLVLAVVSPALAAEVTVIVADFENGTAQVQVDYDDLTLRIARIRVVNNGSGALHLTAVRLDDGRFIAQRFPGGSTTVYDVPQNPASARYIFTLNDGRLDGISFSSVYPYP